MGDISTQNLSVVDRRGTPCGVELRSRPKGETVAKVTGIGGVFFKADDPAALQAWYVDYLGMVPDAEGYMVIRWGEGGLEDSGSTV
ncbi:MAG TPA: hypothetical protein VK969_08825, partial [Acidimicrobiia bacterium]|nr:hypothetical protein [Acidimicrobiia bacterium]